MTSLESIFLVGMNRKEISDLCLNINEKNFRAKQLWHWLYQKGTTDFSAMSSVGASLKEKLSQVASLKRPSPSKGLFSSDGTIKWLLKFEDGQEAEMVFIPEKNRGTLCISSQVGCTLTCKFCHTGTQRLVRNLTAHEIVGQVMAAKDELQDWPSSTHSRKITNIVLMGMGEPLYNFDHVSKALKIITDPEGIALSRRRITLSTAGVVPMMHKCGEELGVNLAVSLHATNNLLRNEIVPLNKKYPLEMLLDACRQYPGLSNARRITFEYIMIKNKNDSEQEARALVQLIKGIPSKINLIPFNPWPGSFYERSSDTQIQRFAEILMKAGYLSPIRAPRGEDILAACGQLKSASMKSKASCGTPSLSSHS